MEKTPQTIIILARVGPETPNFSADNNAKLPAQEIELNLLPGGGGGLLLTWFNFNPNMDK